MKSFLHCRKALACMPDPNLPDDGFITQLSDILGGQVGLDRGPLPGGRQSLWAYHDGRHGIIVKANLSPFVARIALFDAVARPLLAHHHRTLSLTQRNIEAQYVARSQIRRILRADLQASAHDRIFAEVAGTTPLEDWWKK